MLEVVGVALEVVRVRHDLAPVDLEMPDGVLSLVTLLFEVFVDEWLIGVDTAPIDVDLEMV